MILAHRNGTMTIVKMVRSNPKSTVVQEASGTTKYTLKIGEVNRELFDGVNAMEEATKWINEQTAAKKAADLKKKYPLDVVNVGGDTYIVMSKGHHDFDEFMSAVREAGYDWPLGMPEHKWVKTTPDRTGKLNGVYSFVEQGTRGSWPATYSHEAFGDERYEVARLTNTTNRELEILDNKNG